MNPEGLAMGLPPTIVISIELEGSLQIHVEADEEERDRLADWLASKPGYLDLLDRAHQLAEEAGE